MSPTFSIFLKEMHCISDYSDYSEREGGGGVGHIMHLKCLCSIFLEGSVLPFNLGVIGWGAFRLPYFACPVIAHNFGSVYEASKEGGE